VARWSASAALPEGRSRLALALNEGKIYAIGGETASGVTDQLDVYDPQSNGWLPGPRKPTPVSNVSAAVLGGRIYVPGGATATGGVTNVLEVYDVRAASWDARVPLPAPVTAYGLAALGGKLYLFGGWDGRAYRTETYIYDPATDRWTTGTPLPTARAFMAAATLGELIYIAGGYDGQQELAEVLSYNPADDPVLAVVVAESDAAGSPWHLLSPMSQPRAGAAMTTVGTRLYMIGGGWQNALAYSEQYDPKLDAWSKFSTPYAGQWRNLGLVAWDTKLYAVGGWSGSYLAVNEQYQALLRQLLPMGGKG
jgi:N-acetylneuraminic acid mutarotase